MVDACRKANTKLMMSTAASLRPLNLRAIQMIRDGKLGKVQSLPALTALTSGRRMAANQTLGGGGPLMDVGIYSLNACLSHRREPLATESKQLRIDQDGRFNEVEEKLSWTMNFHPACGQLHTTYGATARRIYVYG